MGGRHRHRMPDRGVRWLVGTTVPVLAAAGVTAAVVLGSGAVARSAPEQTGPAAPALAAGQAAPVVAPAVAALAGRLPDGEAAVLAVSRASTSAGERAAANRRGTETTPVCFVTGPRGHNGPGRRSR